MVGTRPTLRPAPPRSSSLRSWSPRSSTRRHPRRPVVAHVVSSRSGPVDERCRSSSSSLPTGRTSPIASPPTRRGDDFGGEIGEGTEDEPALVHPGVGDGEVGLVDGEVAHEQDVDVEDPGPEALGPHPAGRGFELLADLEEFREG